jgi:hypothetical protein
MKEKGLWITRLLNNKKTWIMTGLIILLVIFLFFYLFKLPSFFPVKQDLKHRPDFFGVTFSTKFCQELGLDWKETYQAMLKELKVKYVRLPIYWDEIEKEKGKFDFSDYDYLLDEGEKQGVNFVINPGRRVPRWPECHNPSWLNDNDKETQAATLEMLKTVVERYKNRVSVEYWQIENEPFLDTFGVCPPLDEDFLKQEFALVRSLDNRKIIITGSGELKFWQEEAKIGDIFGSTLYRTVYNSWLGYLKYPIPVYYYHFKGWLAGLSPERLMIMELQAEPWVSHGLMSQLTPEKIEKTMSVDQFRANLQYAINLNFSRTYIWGVEWWYFQKKYGNPQYWWLATVLFQ